MLAWFVAHGGGRPSFRPAWHGGPMSRRIPGTARAMNLYPDYLAFTFLRNPYERFVSLWLDCRRVARERRLARGRGGEEPAGLASLGGFAEFAREVLADFGPCWGREAEAAFRARRDRAYGPGGVRLGDLGWSADHLWPQTAFLPDCNPERLFGVVRANAGALSFVGSLERIDGDFARLGELLGLPAGPPLPRRRESVRCSVESPEARRRRCAAHYDAATRRLVEDLYASDLEFTGCGFGDGCILAAAPGRAGVSVSPARPAVPARRPMATLPARAWFGLCSLWSLAGDRLVDLTAVRRAVRPLALRRGPGRRRRWAGSAGDA